jgi:hypothetical protein
MTTLRDRSGSMPDRSPPCEAPFRKPQNPDAA